MSMQIDKKGAKQRGYLALITLAVGIVTIFARRALSRVSRQVYEVRTGLPGFVWRIVGVVLIIGVLLLIGFWILNYQGKQSRQKDLDITEEKTP